jgi:hypothetical protein
MELPVAIDRLADRIGTTLRDLTAPALMPLPHVPVTAETWDGQRHVRLHGEAIYAVHRGTSAEWAVVVQESNALQPGGVVLVDVAEIRCESRSGRRGG